MTMEGTKFHWYQIWSARWRHDGISNMNESMLAAMSEAERETCILTLLNYLRALRGDHRRRERYILGPAALETSQPKAGDDKGGQRETLESIICQPGLVTLFVEWPRTLAPHAIVWTVECIRVLDKVTVVDEQFHHHHEKIIILTSALHDIIEERLVRWSPVYQLKVLAALLRLKVRASISLMKRLLFDDDTTEEERVSGGLHHHHCSQLPSSLSARSLVWETLRWLASEHPVPFDQSASLGLVALSPWPSARIFLMRAVLWAGSQVGGEEEEEEETKGKGGEGSLPLLSYYISMAEMVEPWKWSWVLISLFNEHEGLLFKMLLMFLDLEERVTGETGSSPSLSSPASSSSSLLQAIMMAINSAQLYVDLLERCGGYDVDALLSSMRAADPQIVASYLYRLYRRGLEASLKELVNEQDTRSNQRQWGVPNQKGTAATVKMTRTAKPTDEPARNQYALLFTHPTMVRFHWRLLERAHGILPDRINHLLYHILSLPSPPPPS